MVSEYNEDSNFITGMLKFSKQELKLLHHSEPPLPWSIFKGLYHTWDAPYWVNFNFSIVRIGKKSIDLHVPKKRGFGKSLIWKVLSGVVDEDEVGGSKFTYNFFE